jgi:hypothetical protein
MSALVNVVFPVSVPPLTRIVLRSRSANGGLVGNTAGNVPGVDQLVEIEPVRGTSGSLE